MRVAIYLSLLVLATAVALWKGTKGEKWAVAVIFVGNVFTLLIVDYLASSFSSVSLVYFILDAIVAILLNFVAIKYPSWVTILVAAFQINGTLGHIVKFLAPHIIPYSYAFLLRFWAWPMVLVLLLSRSLPQLTATLRAKDWPLIFERRSA